MPTGIEWLKAVPMSFVGAKYEPFVELLCFIVVVVISVNILVRLLLRPSMIALAQHAWSLLKEADSVLKHATLYGPEVECVRQRTAPYVFFVMHIIQFAAATFLFLIGLAVFILSFRSGVPWYSPVIISLFMSGALCWGRVALASASWQWHAIKTGEERPPRKPQVNIGGEVMDKGLLSVVPDNETHSIAR
jgi:hypothetical protein